MTSGLLIPSGTTNTLMDDAARYLFPTVRLTAFQSEIIGIVVVFCSILVGFFAISLIYKYFILGVMQAAGIRKHDIGWPIDGLAFDVLKYKIRHSNDDIKRTNMKLRRRMARRERRKRRRNIDNIPLSKITQGQKKEYARVHSLWSSQ